MEEREIRAATRLWALELLVCWIAAGVSEEEFQRMRREMVEAARNATFAHIHPAQSDLLAAELEASISRLVSMIAGMRG